jgi:hypothetical protein
VHSRDRAFGRPSGQIEPQPRDTHFSQGTWDKDIVRMGDNARTGQRPVPTFWVLSEVVNALHFDHTEI